MMMQTTLKRLVAGGAVVVSPLLLSLMVGSTADCGSDDATPGGSDSAEESGAYVGQLVGENDLAGNIDLTLTASTTNAQSVHPLALSNYNVSGSVTLNVNGLGAVALTGTIDAKSGNATFSGSVGKGAGQITFTGTFTNGTLSGTYSGPFGAGNFSISKRKLGLRTFCGTFDGSQVGRWVAFTQNPNAAGVFAAKSGLKGGFKGTFDGTTLVGEIPPTGKTKGTLAGTTLSGEWSDGTGQSGTYTADEGSCGSLPPGPVCPAAICGGSVDAGGDAGGDAGNDAGLAFLPAPSHYWSFDTTTITGTTLSPVLPATGGINGTLAGGITTAAGKVGQALSFDGTDDLVDFGDALDSAIAGAGRKFTVAMWINLPGPFTGNGSNGIAALWAKSSGACPGVTTEREVFLGVLDNGKPYASYATQGNAIDQFGIYATTLLTTSSWHHLVFSYDQTVTTSFADRMAVYVDGVLEAEVPYEYPVGTPFSSAHAILDTPSHLALGAVVSSTQTCPFPLLKGLIDEHAFWDRALSASEITALYAWGNSGKPISP